MKSPTTGMPKVKTHFMLANNATNHLATMRHHDFADNPSEMSIRQLAESGFKDTFMTIAPSRRRQKDQRGGGLLVGESSLDVTSPSNQFS